MFSLQIDLFGLVGCFLGFKNVLFSFAIGLKYFFGDGQSFFWQQIENK